MRIGLYGCGAIGTVIGAFATKAGYDIDLIDINTAHVQALNQEGACVTGFVDLRQPVKAITPEQMAGTYDLIILLCKQTANQAAFSSILPHIDDHSAVLTLQNGFPEPAVSEVFGQDRTLGGAVFWGATFMGPGVSEVTEPLNPQSVLFEIGTPKEHIDEPLNENLTNARDVLSAMGKVEIVDLTAGRWAKLAVNASVSGMSAAMCCTFADVLSHKTAMKVIGHIGYEAGRVCQAAQQRFAPLGGVNIDGLLKKGRRTTPLLWRFFISKSYQNRDNAKASMLQDLEKGQPTEVDMINGYISALGRQHGIPTPANDKVVEVVHGIENKRLPMSPDNIKLFDLADIKKKNAIS